MSLTTTIKSIQDILRKDAGVDDAQLEWMLFLKIFDDQELELTHDDCRSPIPERLRWRTRAQDPVGITGNALLEFINDELFMPLRELTTHTGRNPRGFVVQSVFEHAHKFS